MSFNSYNTIRSIMGEDLEIVDIVPGRSGRAHDAASPCGSLYKIPISPSIPIKISQAKNSPRASLTLVEDLVVVLDRLYTAHTHKRSVIVPSSIPDPEQDKSSGKALISICP